MKKLRVYISGKRESAARYALYEGGLGIVQPIEWFDSYDELLDYCKENDIELE